MHCPTFRLAAKASGADSSSSPALLWQKLRDRLESDVRAVSVSGNTRPGFPLACSTCKPWTWPNVSGRVCTRRKEEHKQDSE